MPLTLPIATLPADKTGPTETPPPDSFPRARHRSSATSEILTSTDLVPLGDYTFADAPDPAIAGFQTLLELAPSMAAQSGRITGIDVIDSDGQAMGRVFTFESDTDPLPPGSFEDATPFFTGDTPTTPKSIGTLDGLTWSDPDGTVHFLIGVSNVVLWALAPSAELLDPTLQAWGESVSQ